MLGTLNLGTYIIGTIAVILLPGPNSLFCLAVAAQHGVKAAGRAVGGILLGDALLMLATAVGAGALLNRHPLLFHGIKLAGGLYLAYIGFNLLRGAVKKWHYPPPAPSEYAADGTTAAPHAFKRALLLSLTNPKAILFFLSFFVQFVDPSYPHPIHAFLLLALILQAVSLIYLSLLVCAGRHMTRLFRRHRKLSAAAMGAVGLMFAGFAVKMWLATV